MRHLVQAQRQRVIERATDHIGEHDNLRPGHAANGEGHEELHEHHARELYAYAPVVAHQLLDLRVLGQDLFATAGVGFVRRHPVEIVAARSEVIGNRGPHLYQASSIS